MQLNPGSPSGFRVLIVGGGLAGLASALALRQAGHHVTVFERAAEFHEIGAGIQLSPNATRLLREWQVLEEVQKYAFQPETGTLRSYRGTVISRTPPGSLVERLYQSPYLVVHRADLLKVLAAAGAQRGIVMHMGAEITSIDFSKPSLLLISGQEFVGDLILGADGERSYCRSELLHRPDLPTGTGDVVFRVAVPRLDIDDKHPSWELMQQASVNVWMGPGAHGVSYLLRNAILNVVLVLHRDSPGDRVMYGAQPADLNELKAAFANWDPALQGLLDVQECDCAKWSLLQTDELANWCHAHGKFALIGDAAHAIFPYLAQGAAQSFEDAGVLGGIFARLKSPSQIKDALRVFEEVRKPRVVEVRRRTLLAKEVYSLADGPMQEARDAKLLQGPMVGSPNALADPSFQRWLWGYDAMAEGAQAWDTFLAHATREE